MALLASSGLLFFFTLFILSLLGIIFLIVSLIKLPENEFRYRTSQGIGLFIMTLFPVMIFSLFMTFFSVPEMSFVKFQANHVQQIYPLYYKNKITEYKNQPTLIATHLENGVVHHTSWVSVGKYKILEQKIYKKYPDAVNHIIYHPDISQVLNKKFLQCFDKKDFTIPNQAMTISDMQYHIGLEEENCINYAIDFLIDDLSKT